MRFYIDRYAYFALFVVCSCNLEGSISFLGPNQFNDAASIGLVGLGAVKKPRILVLGSVDQNTGGLRLNPRWIKSLEPYDVECIVVDPSSMTRVALEALLPLADGMLLTGADINIRPELYGKNPISQRAYWGDNPPVYCHDDRRFNFSKRMIEYAIDHKVPVLGVCLAMQEMNVVLGGTLEQKLDGHMTPHADTDDLWDSQLHTMYLSKIGQLTEIFGLSVMAQNSVHNVGMIPSGLAPGLNIEAMAGDNRVVEAFSLPGHPFCMGVQFHAESARFIPENALLMKHLTDKAREHAYPRAFMDMGMGGAASRVLGRGGQNLIMPRTDAKTGMRVLAA